MTTTTVEAILYRRSRRSRRRRRLAYYHFSCLLWTLVPLLVLVLVLVLVLLLVVVLVLVLLLVLVLVLVPPSRWCCCCCCCCGGGGSRLLKLREGPGEALQVPTGTRAGRHRGEALEEGRVDGGGIWFWLTGLGPGGGGGDGLVWTDHGVPSPGRGGEEDPPLPEPEPAFWRSWMWWRLGKPAASGPVSMRRTTTTSTSSTSVQRCVAAAAADSSSGDAGRGAEDEPLTDGRTDGRTGEPEG
ncbi:hypothetical protein CRUP_030677 [Coryphaenoides rupestris]|nr:hypothetical protein CRUP_030677 [Coryphaenoides rupestris]